MLTPKQVLDLNYLEVRCMLVETAASLDRFDRAVEASGEAASPAEQAQLDLLYQALSLLAARNAAPNRSERLLQLFTDPE